jgi:hypothetical protein
MGSGRGRLEAVAPHHSAALATVLLLHRRERDPLEPSPRLHLGDLRWCVELLDQELLVRDPAATDGRLAVEVDDLRDALRPCELGVPRDIADQAPHDIWRGGDLDRLAEAGEGVPFHTGRLIPLPDPL